MANRSLGDMTTPTPEERKERTEYIRLSYGVRAPIKKVYELVRNMHDFTPGGRVLGELNDGTLITYGDVAQIIENLRDELSRREQEHPVYYLEEIERESKAWKKHLCAEHYDEHEYNEPKEGVDCFECTEMRHAEEIRKAKAEGWDEGAEEMSELAAMPVDMEKFRASNPHRAPSTPPAHNDA